MKHADPNDQGFSTTLKEAVIEGVVRRSHDRLTGRGDLGKLIVGDPPTKVLAAGFLLPAVRKTSDTDGTAFEVEVTSPIHIATLGMSFQVDRATPGTLQVKPEGAIYVRVLPNKADMTAADLTFGLRRDLRSEMKATRTTLVEMRLREANLRQRGDTDEQRKQIAEIRREAHKEAFLQLASRTGLSREVIDSAKDDAVPAVDPVAIAAALSQGEGLLDPEDSATLSAASDTDIAQPDEDRSTVVWTIRPDHSGVLPDDGMVEPAEMPQKWLRLDLDWPTFTFDPGWSAEEINAAGLRHSDAMQQALHDRLTAWLTAEDTEKEIGGRLWAMPYATNQSPTHKVRPHEVAKWEAHLTKLRGIGGRKAVPTLSLRVEVRVSDDPIDASRRTVRIILANRSAMVDQSRVPDKLMDRTLYMAGLRVQASLGLHRNHLLERVRPSYRWNEWLEHAGLGINCGLECERPANNDSGILLRTTFMPQWRQPRIVPYDISPRPTFQALTEADGGLGVAHALIAAYETWIKGIIQAEPWRTSHPISAEDEQRERRAFDRDVECWKNELARIRLGLKILEECAQAMASGTPSDDIAVSPLRAWRATNAAFLRAHQEAQKRKVFAPSSWRLFQLAFLLSHLPGVVSRIPGWDKRTDLFLDGMETDDATASLLYFPTGGGKSEAFFGLLVLQAFVDRLRGKRRGVSAIVRYPLRLLTTQQANRFARILAMAELERVNSSISGDPFQIGFWVGGGNTPNYPSIKDGFNELPRWEAATLTTTYEEQLRATDAGYRTVSKWRRLTECPFCGFRLVALRRRSEGKSERLTHVCVSSACDWNKLHGGPEPLPFHVMDTDIYAYAPTILLGTVDKMAAIAQNPSTIARVFGMFGFAPWMVRRVDAASRPLPGNGRLEHPRKPKVKPGAPQNDAWTDPANADCIPIGPVFGNSRIELFDPFPAIEVQDEAHLLEQSLGTFSGLFGSMLETALADLAPQLGSALTSKLPNGRPRRAKVIAASATVQGPERQIKMLYQRQVRTFPHPGPDLYTSFFARLEEPPSTEIGRTALNHPELRTPTRRIYASMPTNGRPHTSATVAVLSALHLTLTETYTGAISDTVEDRTTVGRLLSDALPEDALRDLHRAAIANANPTQLASALDLARIVLCYVTSKKGGDSVQAALSEFVPRDHARAGVEIGTSGGVETGLITGSVEIDTIQAIVEQAKPAWKPGEQIDLERDFLSALRGIVATSAISHGVDIERLNMMVFAGLPSDVAEYVQASSRVGRTHVGVSILVPTPQRVRDVHVVGIHDVFHRFLERMVQPAAVDRWGENAIDRVVASAVQIMCCAVDHFNQLCAASSDDSRKRLWDSSGVNRIRSKIASAGYVSASQGMTDFLSRAVGIEKGSDPRHDPTKIVFAPPEGAWYNDLLNSKVRRVLEDMRIDTFANSTLRTFWTDTHRPEPMTSLRDVDEAGVLLPAKKSVVDNRPAPKELAQLMRRLRQGDGAWSESEGDTDTAIED